MRTSLIAAFLLCACGSDKGKITDSGVVEVPCEPAEEVCNGVDDDCDGRVDEDATDAPTWYTDLDGDGYGQDGSGEASCTEPSTASTQPGDCNDADGAVHPGADERCNGADDDCDEDIDEDPVDSELAYTDADGDGYGDPATAVDRCPVDDELVTTGDDCNDADASIHPNATELCNDLDDDCDSSTSEDQTALWHPADGSPAEDWTAALLAGSSSEATVLLIEDPGRLDVCPGTWAATFRVRADLDLVGLGTAPDEVVFDGTSLQGVVIARTDTGADVSIENLTLSNGAGVGAVLGELTAGGGIECVGERTLTLDAVTLSDSSADVGAGLFVDGCTVIAQGVQIHDNDADYYGGGIAVLSGSVDLVESDVRENRADFGGGLAVVDLEEVDPSVTLDLSAVTGNTASKQGGGAVIEGGSLSCELGAIMENLANEGGGVLLDLGGELSSTSCEWGESGTSDDNDPSDVRVIFEDFDHYGSAATFTCDEEGCQ